MPRFFVMQQPPDVRQIAVTGEDHFHISRTLRMKPGERVTLCDGCGTEYDCAVSAVEAEQTLFDVLRCGVCEQEPKVRVSLFQCVPKGDKMDTIVQKAVELGVAEIVPVLSQNCVVRLDAKGGAKKAQRWQKIAKAAAEQCGRGVIPAVAEPISFAQALERMGQSPCGVMFYELAQQGNSLRELMPRVTTELAFLVGSEGGFTPQEAKQAEEAGLAVATLGRRILRTETVAGMVLAIVMYETQNI